jgi:hypothetical protein
MACICDSEAEAECRKDWSINRDKSREPHYAHSGKQPGSSIKTIWQSRFQLKLVALACAWYGFQTLIYLVLANLVVYITFHNIPPDSPSYPGANATNGTNPFYHKELYDVGFHFTTDLSHRPFWLKAMFVDLMVSVAQMVVPFLLLLQGHTYGFVNYTAIVGIMNILKGIVAIATILPPARQGEKCWLLNYPDEKLFVLREPFSNWAFETWGMVHGCNDMLWSGHTSQSCLGMLYLENLMRHAGCPCAVRFLLVIYFGVYVFAVLACRMHYTIDVLVAMLIAIALYTHSGLRFWIWTLANTFVCNPEGDSFEEYEDEADDEDDAFE